MPSPWSDFLTSRNEELAEHPRFNELMLLMVDARRWHEPVYYSKKAAGVDRAKAAVQAEPMNYWEAIVMRALIMLDMTPEEREAKIAEALAAHKEATKRCTTDLYGTPGTYREVDLSKLTI